MRRLTLALALALLATPACAQVPTFPAGPSNQSSLALIAPTAAATDSSNRIATTAWVNSWAGTAMPLASGKIWIGSAGNVAVPQTPSGDLTVSAGGAFTLATVNANTGAFGSTTQCATITTNGKGLITAASAATCAPAIGSITGVAAGWATFGATPSSANLRALLTDETGTGLAYFQGGDIGTPSAGVGTNLTALNASNLSSGTVAAARGGAGTITGALKGSGAGVVTQAACADLSNGAASCSTDTTNAANISSGTLPNARIVALNTNTNIAMQTTGFGGVVQGTTAFMGTGANVSGSETAVQSPVSAPFTLKNFYASAKLNVVAAGQTLTLTVRKNTADTTITCVITGTGTACNDTTHTASYVAGDLIDVKLVTSATTGTIDYIYTMSTAVTTSP